MSRGVVDLSVAHIEPASRISMVATQSDSYGLAELYCPDDPVVDICFVHGLGGGSLSTWTLNEVCWPRDLLSTDIPDARILTFGYDASIIRFLGKVSQNSLDEHAMDLLAALADHRVNLVSRPKGLA